jgi:hypothetical protein
VVIEIFSPVREDLHPDTEYAPFIQSWNRWSICTIAKLIRLALEHTGERSKERVVQLNFLRWIPVSSVFG